MIRHPQRVDLYLNILSSGRRCRPKRCVANLVCRHQAIIIPGDESDEHPRNAQGDVAFGESNGMALICH
jgi:hypothetical protein